MIENILSGKTLSQSILSSQPNLWFIITQVFYYSNPHTVNHSLWRQPLIDTCSNTFSPLLILSFHFANFFCFCCTTRRPIFFFFLRITILLSCVFIILLLGFMDLLGLDFCGLDALRIVWLLGKWWNNKEYKKPNFLLSFLE